MIIEARDCQVRRSPKGSSSRYQPLLREQQPAGIHALPELLSQYLNSYSGQRWVDAEGVCTVRELWVPSVMVQSRPRCEIERKGASGKDRIIPHS